MATNSEQAAMRRAVALSAHGLGTTSPNPVVGCVVLDASDRPAGEGYHACAGGPHAEVVALAAAGTRARGGTAVVTLEPCAHTGRTGPCTSALLASGVRRVLFAVADPDPRAAGGADVLRAAGVAVEGGLLATEAARVNEAWLFAVRAGRPHVTWKYAASLDGRVTAADGSSRWISGVESRADAHRLRARVDAVLVGTGTALADDPQLTVRDVNGLPAERQPLRVVVGIRTLPPDARVFDGAAETLLIRERDPRAVLAILHARAVRSVLLEGGPTLAGCFLAEGLVNRVVGYVAPLLIGEAGLPVVAGMSAKTLTDAVRLDLDEVTRFGADVRLSARLHDRERPSVHQTEDSSRSWHGGR